MLIPLTDPKNTYAAQMLRLIYEQRKRAETLGSPQVVQATASADTDRVHESRARTIVARAFARRRAHAAPSL